MFDSQPGRHAMADQPFLSLFLETGTALFDKARYGQSRGPW